MDLQNHYTLVEETLAKYLITSTKEIIFKKHMKVTWNIRARKIKGKLWIWGCIKRLWAVRKDWKIIRENL